MPSELQHTSLPDTARCLTPRNAVHRPSQRSASAIATHSPSDTTLPPRLPMPSSAQSTKGLSRFQGTFRPISHRARNIYIMYRKQKHTFFEKKMSQCFASMTNHPTFAIAKREQALPSEAERPEKHIGRLAQLVQSVCLTSRGSAVRIRQRPQEIRWNGSLAQLNRAFDYGSKGYRFESYRSHTRVQASSYWVDTRVAKWGRL